MTTPLKPNLAYLPTVEADGAADVRSLLDQKMQGCTFTWPDLLLALKCFLDEHPEIATLKFTPESLAMYAQQRSWLQVNSGDDGTPRRFSFAIKPVYGLTLDDRNYFDYSPLDPT